MKQNATAIRFRKLSGSDKNRPLMVATGQHQRTKDAWAIYPLSSATVALGLSELYRRVVMVGQAGL